MPAVPVKRPHDLLPYRDAVTASETVAEHAPGRHGACGAIGIAGTQEYLPKAVVTEDTNDRIVAEVELEFHVARSDIAEGFRRDGGFTADGQAGIQIVEDGLAVGFLEVLESRAGVSNRRLYADEPASEASLRVRLASAQISKPSIKVFHPHPLFVSPAPALKSSFAKSRREANQASPSGQGPQAFG
jgi:hypothetical protein